MNHFRLFCLLGDPNSLLSSFAAHAKLIGNMRCNLCLLLLILASPASAADRTEDVRATEVAFAKAFAERQAKKFFAYVADDAQFLGQHKIMHGKQEVIAVWSEYFKPAVAPFRWQPERVVTNAAGDLGFTNGPVFDETGAQIGTFTSTWARQPDGSWKILFDGGSACPPSKPSAQ
jgi:ketosteroid isomerase-like protein